MSRISFPFSSQMFFFPLFLLIKHFNRAKVKGREGVSKREGCKKRDEWMMQVVNVAHFRIVFGLVFSDAVQTTFVSCQQAMLGNLPWLVILRRCDVYCDNVPNQLLSQINTKYVASLRELKETEKVTGSIVLADCEGVQLLNDPTQTLMESFR